ncbi:MAG: alpha/beta hydrolase [Sulfurimonas sp.]
MVWSLFLDSFFSVALSEVFVHQASDTLKKLKNRILRFSPVGIKGGLLAMVSRTDTTQSLNGINSPVLLISGENDKIIPPDTMKDMAKKIKNHTFVSLHNSGHMSMYENPDAFKSAMHRFLTSIE